MQRGTGHTVDACCGSIDLVVAAARAPHVVGTTSCREDGVFTLADSRVTCNVYHWSGFDVDDFADG